MGKRRQTTPVADTNACRALADLCRTIAALQQPSPKVFLQLLGEQAAGIRRRPCGLFDLMRGGQDIIVGGGFREEYNDGSYRQVRHFVGIAVATVMFGPQLTKVLSLVVLRDAPNSPDGRLSEAAIDFSLQLLSGELPVSAAGDWIETHLAAESSCRPGKRLPQDVSD